MWKPGLLTKGRKLLLPRTWQLRARLRDIEEEYGPLIARAEGDARLGLIHERALERMETQETLDGLQTQELLRRAWKYYIAAPQEPRDSDMEDANWQFGPVSNTWYLKPAGIGAIQRQIEEARKRRREAWQSWANIVIAVGSIIVSGILAWRR